MDVKALVQHIWARVMDVEQVRGVGSIAVRTIPIRVMRFTCTFRSHMSWIDDNFNASGVSHFGKICAFLSKKDDVIR